MTGENESVIDGENWITDMENGLVRKRENLYSSVCVVITNDSKRLKQLKEYAVGSGIAVSHNNGGEGEYLDKENVFCYDTWTGLDRLMPDVERIVRHERVNIDTGMGMDMPSDAMIPPLPMCKHIERDLKTKPTIAILHNFIQPNEFINLALNSWAFDESIMDNNSTVVVVIPSRTVSVNGQATELIPKDILKKCNVLEIPPSTNGERNDLIVELSNMVEKPLESREIDRLVDITGGLDLNQLESALIETICLKGDFDYNHLTKIKGSIISKEHDIEIEMAGRFGFERIGGYNALKKFTHDNIITALADTEMAKLYGVELPKGVLVFGMGGTGKTVYAKALARELAIPFVSLKPQDIASKWYGESEQRMNNILKLVDELSPCLVYIDEIDTIMTKRDGGNQHEATGRTMNVLMQWLANERNSLVWATTNCIENIDEAGMRVGRFDYVLPQLLPDILARKDILKVHLETVRNIVHNLSDKDFERVASKTNLWAGNELEHLVKQTAKNVYKRAKEQGLTASDELMSLSVDDMLGTLKNTSVNTDKRKETQEKYIKLAQEYVNDNAFIDELRMTNGKAKPKSRMEQAKDKVSKQ